MPELITGTKGTPHITSTQDRAIYEKIIGKNSYILDDNELLEPELQSNQSLRIRSGMLYHHGSITEVKRNTYDEVTIANGSQGMKRIDLVVARYTKNPETEIEEMNWVVIQGTPAASDPVAPAYTEGNMQEGDLTDDCPVFEVHLDGIQVTEVVKLLTVLSGSLEELNSKTEFEDLTLDISNSNWKTGYCTLKAQNGVLYMDYYIQHGSDAQGAMNYAVGTIPSGYRPQRSYDIRSAAWCSNLNGQRYGANVRINAQGVVSFVGGGTFREAGFSFAIPI